MAVSATLKKKKKSWYGMYAPRSMNSLFLGESTVYNKEDLNSKKLKLNLSTFTNDIRKQNTDVSFSVVTVVDNRAVTEVIGLDLTAAYLKRLVRRGRNKVDDSFLAKSKDKKIIRVKTIMITKSRTNRSVTSRLRLELRSVLKKMLKITNAEDFFNSLINQRVQKDFKDKLSKIYPLKYVDVRSASFEKERIGVKVEEVSDTELEKEAASKEEMKEAAEKEEKVPDEK